VHVDDARNQLVSEFLRSECTDFVFIDSDIGWQASDLIKLLNYDRQIVAGTYPLKQDDEAYPTRHLPGEIWTDEDGLMEMEGVPTGFLRIKRCVLEKLYKDARKYRVKGSDYKHEMAEIFERDIVDNGRVSGDYIFCRKAREAGFKIYLDPYFYLEHVGENTWEGTYASYLRRKNGLALQFGIDAVKRNTWNNQTLVELVQEWGNYPYSAGEELLYICIQIAKQSEIVLETGSGLSTLVMAAANPELAIHSLEADYGWLCKTREAAERLNLSNITLHYAPLKEYSNGKWYGLPDLPWDKFDTVLCDGPPRKDSNRSILFDMMEKYYCEPQRLIVDDADTEALKVERWSEANNYQAKLIGKIKPFMVSVKEKT